MVSSLNKGKGLRSCAAVVECYDICYGFWMGNILNDTIPAEFKNKHRLHIIQMRPSPLQHPPTHRLVHCWLLWTCVFETNVGISPVKKRIYNKPGDFVAQAFTDFENDTFY